ncbi:MAG: pentapeptide repeat-containing protein [Chloroflexi bacterium]|nr:MAG: pentapeptide repeat-containing protein [Chloroflexota bacterium]
MWRFREISNRTVILLLTGMSIAASVGSLIVNLANGQSPSQWFQGWLQNFSTEMVGALLTFVLLQLIVEERRRREELSRAEHERKEQLIREMGSIDNGIAIRAVRELGAKKWLYDGTLVGASLWRANLQDCYLTAANLRNADLNRANFRDAKLVNACLQGARLFDADLQGARLDNAQFDEETILPDGSNWSPDVDMECFTNPEHPKFWRSKYPKSPAYGAERV